MTKTLKLLSAFFLFEKKNKLGSSTTVDRKRNNVWQSNIHFKFVFRYREKALDTKIDVVRHENIMSYSRIHNKK